MNRKDKLKHIIKNFDTSCRTKDDYMELFVVLNSCLKQGSGLLLGDVEKILENVLNED